MSVLNKLQQKYMECIETKVQYSQMQAASRVVIPYPLHLHLPAICVANQQPVAQVTSLIKTTPLLYVRTYMPIKIVLYVLLLSSYK